MATKINAYLVNHPSDLRLQDIPLDQPQDLEYPSVGDLPAVESITELDGKLVRIMRVEIDIDDDYSHPGRALIVMGPNDSV